MIQIDLTNDAPMIETVEGDGFIHLSTATSATETDRVVLHRAASTSDVPFAASARSTQRFGSKTIEYSVRERDLPDFGRYEVHCWTRRGQERTYHIEFAKVADDDSKVTLTVDPKSTPCSWVTEADVHASKTEKLVIELSLRS